VILGGRIDVFADRQRDSTETARVFIQTMQLLCWDRNNPRFWPTAGECDRAGSPSSVLRCSEQLIGPDRLKLRHERGRVLRSRSCRTSRFRRSPLRKPLPRAVSGKADSSSQVGITSFSGFSSHDNSLWREYGWTRVRDDRLHACFRKKRLACPMNQVLHSPARLL